MKLVFELNETEQLWWKKTIQKFREKYIKAPREYIDDYLSGKIITLDIIKPDVSKFIFEVREGCWDIYIKDEINFHKEVILHLVKERELPKAILNEIIVEDLFDKNNLIINEHNIYDKLSSLVGDFAGRVMPYFYALSLSTTNSRRSRAGTTFEAIISYIMGIYKYPFEDQSSLGTAFYKSNGLGKMVDGIIPSKKSYEQNRSKCQVITMKTTLREGWQEVVEELNRTNIPHIYLLTLDNQLSEGVLQNMQHQNITVVNYDEIKEKYKNYENIIAFSTFFNKEIPHVLSYWEGK